MQGNREKYAGKQRKICRETERNIQGNRQRKARSKVEGNQKVGGVRAGQECTKNERETEKNKVLKRENKTCSCAKS